MKTKGKKLSVPREMEEIRNNYNDLAWKAGQLQYQITVYQEELRLLNEQLKKVNNEANARGQLDAIKKASETPVEAKQEAVADGQ